jgi:homoserine acetyltransferase
VEVREFQVKPNHRDGGDDSAGAEEEEEEEESDHSNADELPWIADGILETLQRCQNSLLVVVSESDALMPPSSSSRRTRDVDDDCT